MPSVEIICLGQREPSRFESPPFVLQAENVLVSHRSPSPLFQADFDELSGCIYHLGRLRGEDESKGFYTAYDLMDKEKIWEERIQFKTELIPFISLLLQELLSNSPLKSVVFTTDYQFGPARRKYSRPLSLNEFWEQHDQGKLWMNAMYYLK